MLDDFIKCDSEKNLGLDKMDKIGDDTVSPIQLIKTNGQDEVVPIQLIKTEGGDGVVPIQLIKTNGQDGVVPIDEANKMEGGDAAISKTEGGDGVNRMEGGDGLNKMEGGDEGNKTEGGDAAISKTEGGDGVNRMEGGDGLNKMEGGDGLNKMEGGDEGNKMEGGDGLKKMEGGDMMMMKKKRGRGGVKKKRVVVVQKDEGEEEDVCFICFDGGSLVLCDRRGCPKAYHPTCVKRDEAFFQSKAKWNCGWHICSICQKAAHHMCYTCTYSLCKSCAKDTDYLSVRENKGLCVTCMKIVMLIENNVPENKETVQVDFDDKSSWEYLFKVYWVYLKGKLSLTLDELIQAKKPCKEVLPIAHKEQQLDVIRCNSECKSSISDVPFQHLEVCGSKKRRIRKQPILPNVEDGQLAAEKIRKQPILPNVEDGQTAEQIIKKKPSLPIVEDCQAERRIKKKPSLPKVEDGQAERRIKKKPNLPKVEDGQAERRIKKKPSLPKLVDGQRAGLHSDRSSNLSRSTVWATKELLEFVAHMRNGDLSVVSQFEVQGFLLEYIKKNNLRDPQKKSQILCDARLEALFQKPRVGHFEMLKLLEYHFLIKEDKQKENMLDNPVHAIPDQVEGGGNNESLLMTDKDKKRKFRRKGEEKGPQTNPDELAAIDVHNINLIYLRRSLMENLVTTNGKFYDKVVGSIVRIRISGGDPKQDIYRLVQVIGTVKAAVPYKVGGKTVDVMLKILNLNKKEIVAVDAISNQNFSEDECRRLHQSIKCGLVKQMTVGQVQEKARALQEVRLNDWLETEILRLNHLRDRASEHGRKKELRECVEKIELLKSPEERQRRLHESPQIHPDPQIDRKCESDDDTGEIRKKKQADQGKHRRSEFRKLARDLVSTPNKIKQAKFSLDKGVSSKLGEKVHELQKRKEACVSKLPDVTPSKGNAPSAYNSETEKVWQYRDPIGNIQGPFCVVQLRKWSTSGYFPPDMRVWTINTDEVDSLLLADVLNGNIHEVLPSRSNSSLPYQDRFYICEDRHSSTVNPTLVNDGKLSNGSWNCSSATSVHQLTVHKDGKWNTGPTKVNTSSNRNTLHPNVEHKNQTDSQRFSVQSSVESWRPLAVNIASNNSDSNFTLSSVPKSADSSDHPKINALNLPSPTPIRTTNQMTSHSSAAQNLGMEDLPSPTPKPIDRDEKASLGIQNLPSPSPTIIDMDEKVDSSTENSPTSLPSARDADEKVQTTESHTPGPSETLTSSTPARSGRNEKTDLFAQNFQSPSPKMVYGDEKVSLSIPNSPCSAPRPIEPEKLCAYESKPSVKDLTCDSFAPKSGDQVEKSAIGIQNLQSTSPTMVDNGENVGSTMQHSLASPLRLSLDNKQVQADESKPSSTNLASTSCTAIAKDRDEKIDARILSSPLPETVDEDIKIDSFVQNMPSSPVVRDANEIIQANESKPPETCLTCTYSISKPSDRHEKADMEIQNIPSPSLKKVDDDDKVDSAVHNLSTETDVNDKVLANKEKPPGTSLTRSSISPELNNGDVKAGIGSENLVSASPKVVAGEGNTELVYPYSLSSLIDANNGNDEAQGNESKPPCSSLVSFSNTAEPSDRDEKGNVGIQNSSSPSSPKMGDVGGNSGLAYQKSPSSAIDPKDGSEKVQTGESKPPCGSLICISSTAEPSDRDEKANIGVQNLPNPSAKTVDGNAGSTDQNPPSSIVNLKDGNEKVHANESKPLCSSSLICISSTAEPSDRDEKANIGVQNLSSPSAKMVDGIGNAGSTDQNPASSLIDLKDEENVQASESKPPCSSSLICVSSTAEPSDRDEKANNIGVQNLSSPSAKMVDRIGKAGSTDQNPASSLIDLKDGEEKVQASESKPPSSSSLICVSSTAEPTDRYDKANIGIQKKLSPSPKVVDGEEVNLTSCSPNTSCSKKDVEAKQSNSPNTRWASNSSLVEGSVSQLEHITNEKPPEVSSGQAAPVASNYDLFAPSTSNHPCGTFNWRSFDYEPIEFSTLAEESVSDLLAEVDAMEAQGDVISPTSAMFSGDDFFEDSKGDYFGSIHGMGHLFDFGKNDDVSSSGDLPSLPHHSATISEPLAPTTYHNFNPTDRSIGEASTSTGLGAASLHNHNSGSQPENGLDFQNNWGNLEVSINPGFGGSSQEMVCMGWGSNPGLAQANMDMKQNTLFGFMGHERQGDWKEDGVGSGDCPRPQAKGRMSL